MKKILHNNQVIITALAIMIAIAGYLNFSNNSSKNIGMSTEFYEASEEVVADNTLAKKETTKKKTTNGDKTTKKEKKEKTGKSKDKEVLNAKEDNKEVQMYTDDNVGEAVLVNSNITLDYFYTVRLDREQTRAKSKEELSKIVENKSVTEKEREVAVNKIVELTANSEKENASEMMLEAKGFKNAVVSIVDGKADVIIDAKSISSKEVAQVVDIVNRKTGIEINNIVVTPVNSNSKTNE